MKAAVGTIKTHNPFEEARRASCLRENLTSSSYGEGLETGRALAQAPRQSLTRPAFNEADSVARHMEAYGERFGKLPPYFVGDMKYGTRKNRTDLETLGVRPSFKPLGRKTKQRDDAWFKKKQKERNRIEGGFGHGKEHFGLARVRYKGEETSEVWVRLGLMTMNLMTARKRT